ncbi:hypothetical protein EJ06DRAFT_489958 [Trichodelitschia bisporula]|uniref:LysM domain-containing protein n=1 Tax=Trichodelitschia bisporula TaxID=703511 RepID=A0A6G1I496_9PEZI|nr:hypothetical protein EJ06DRAFT_489958 [Trichodelitschia bisporula]
MNLPCHARVGKFAILQYRDTLPSTQLTTAICAAECSSALGQWFHSVEDACKGETWAGEPPTLIPGRMWQGWNESCIFEPRTGKNCNDVIDGYSDYENVEAMDKEHLCSYCWVRRHEAMRSPYGMYDAYYAHVMEVINAKCGLSKPTSIPSPLIATPAPKSAFCATATFYTTVAGDSCSSIGLAKNVSSSELKMANPDILRECEGIPAGKRLCLPYPCKVVSVGPSDSCMGIELKNDFLYGTLVKNNPWLDWGCTNLQSGVKNMGNVLCVTPAAGTVNLTVPGLVLQPGSGGRGG